MSPQIAPTEYRVNNVYSAIQGEGVHAGLPMVLVRLQFCPVHCPFCDTKETWAATTKWHVPTLAEAMGQGPKWTTANADDLVEWVKANHPGPRWIMLTGGEPAEQNLSELVRAFHFHGYRVQLETSGTADGHLRTPYMDDRPDWVTVSPKPGMPGGRSIIQHVVAKANEIKQVVGTVEDVATLVENLQRWKVPSETTISLQPLSVGQAATEMATRECIRRGWRLSVQMHKYLNLP